MVNRIIIIVCSVLVLLLTACHSDEADRPVDDNQIHSSQDVYDYYELEPQLSAPNHSSNEYDISSNLSYRISHLPTSFSHTSVELCDDGRVMIEVEVSLSSGYHASSDVVNMIVNEMQLILNNSDFNLFEYDVQVNFDEGKEYYTVHDGFKMIDSGFGGYSYLRKE